MAIKIIKYDNNINRKIIKTKNVNGKPIKSEVYFCLTEFIADSVSDIAYMNSAGSEYLNYPAGSAVLCIEDGNVYILNAIETEYMALGGE